MASRRTDIKFKSFDTEQEWKWFHLYVPTPWAYDARGLIAYRDGTPIAGCVMQNFCAGSVEVHQAILKPTVLRHGWLELVADVALANNRGSMYSLVSEDNEKALKLNKHIGFRETGRIPDGDHPGVDLVLLVLPRDECRYLKENRDGWRQDRGS